MLGEMIKKQVSARFLSFMYLFLHTTLLREKFLLFKLSNFYTSAYLNLNYGAANQ